jgi:hypothetical protein
MYIKIIMQQYKVVTKLSSMLGRMAKKAFGNTYVYVLGRRWETDVVTLNLTFRFLVRIRHF